MLPIAAEIAVRQTRAQALSAMPDAPVIDEAPPKPRVHTRRRLQLARLLRELADRIEPAAPCPPTTSAT